MDVLRAAAARGGGSCFVYEKKEIHKTSQCHLTSTVQITHFHHSTIRRLFASKPLPSVGHSCAVCQIPSTTNLIWYVPGMSSISATNKLLPPSMCSGDIATPLVQWSKLPMMRMSLAMPTQRIGTFLIQAASIVSTSLRNALDIRSSRLCNVSRRAVTTFRVPSLDVPPSGRSVAASASIAAASIASCAMPFKDSISSIAATKRSFACLMSLSRARSVNSRNLANLLLAARRSLRRVRRVTICSNKRLWLAAISDSLFVFVIREFGLVGGSMPTRVF